jgi:hypothetical protein
VSAAPASCAYNFFKLDVVGVMPVKGDAAPLNILHASRSVRDQWSHGFIRLVTAFLFFIPVPAFGYSSSMSCARLE